MSSPAASRQWSTAEGPSRLIACSFLQPFARLCQRVVRIAHASQRIFKKMTLKGPYVERLRVEVFIWLEDGHMSPLLIDSGWIGSGRGAARAEVAQGIPTQSHVSPSMLVCEDKSASNPHHVYSYTKKNPARVSHRPCTNEARTDHSRQKGAYSETRSFIKVPRDKRAGRYPLVTGTNLKTPHSK